MTDSILPARTFMNSELPEHLKERTRRLDQQPLDGAFILYWMRNAIRVDENPALDVARWFAHQHSLPLLVYHGLSEHYKFASDRHHTFILQAARDVQRQFRKLDVSYAMHLATSEDRKPHLITLAESAALVITEDMPVDPPRRFLNSLAAKTTTPIMCVDTACVVPMLLVQKPYTRAFQFRSATRKLFTDRLARAWPEMDLPAKPHDLSALPFEPLDLQQENIAELVSRSEIDHSVGPVVDSIGGSQAGYHRWNQFKANGLGRYARNRNNALIDGVSRISPYLHYGMVSPMRIAREAAAIGNAGSEKYLDELLIWRELAYAFCFHRDDHDQWSAVPDWARQTLDAHAGDPRHNTYCWEQLARGQTDDPLWNAAQKSLLMQGELHNNVRMTWGKAILNWTKSPEQALAMMIDLNHRYALDGRDPASYGGILWCLGQFDRPFEPERPVIGTIRPRPTAAHANRLDPADYLTKVATPRFEPVPHIAVIGAGISGLFAARTLTDHGLKVTVFEKSRGVGGRMATRRVAGGTGFDHGAQYFTARDPRFGKYVQSWLEQGLVAPWPDRELAADQRIVVIENGKIQSESTSEQRFVAVPAMNSICKHLASGLEIHKQTRVACIETGDAGIRLLDDQTNDLGTFDRLIVSAPAEQSAELLANVPTLSKPISNIRMNPCWAAMVTFDKSITNQWAGAFLHGSFLAWAARNSTKPDRPDNSDRLVLHAKPDWTSENWECDSDRVAKQMIEEFWRVSGLSPQLPSQIQVHRWKYAIAVEPSDRGCYFDADAGVAVCGDWACGSRVEGAFLSGLAAAGRMLGTLSIGGSKIAASQKPDPVQNLALER